MTTFKLKVDATFEADSLEDACFQLIAHFMRVGDIASHDVDSCSLEPEFLEHVGTFDMRKEEQ
mgnify:CR=1 FL=1